MKLSAVLACACLPLLALSTLALAASHKHAAPASPAPASATASPAASGTATPGAAPTGAMATPNPPEVDARGYILTDYVSGQVLAQRNADARMEPASLTKLMTCYVVFHALKTGTRIWIITEADRSVTTVLLPQDY